MRITLQRHWLISKVDGKRDILEVYGDFTIEQIKKIINDAYYGRDFEYLYDDMRTIAYDIELWQIAKYGKEVV